MSTTTVSDDEDRNAFFSTDKNPRYKRRKVAILFAYCGVGYKGMQKNPGAKTIESDLQEALYFSGAVPEKDRGCPQRFDFARSARTDKGVSAVGQVVSGKFYIDPPGFVERLNNNLPPQIRVFGYKRVTASFNAKKFCDGRRYVYLLPSFALDATSHRDRESVLASVGSENELVKCLGCSERGRKFYRSMAIPGTFGKTNGSKVESQSGISSNTSSALFLDNGNVCKVTLNPVSEAANPSCSNGEHDDSIVNEKVFSYGDKEKQRFNQILKQFEGTHNFHNFTTRTKAADPSANRYIISFHADSTVTVDGIEFVKCEVVGQSFMLHQIRKMIGFAVAIMRNCAPESFIKTALQQDVNVNVPTAPEVGLYLEECLFSSYNQKWEDTHEEVSMKAYTEEAEEFKQKHINSHIASTEHKYGNIAVWLHSLNHRNYPDLSPKENNGAKSEAGTQTERTTRLLEKGILNQAFRQSDSRNQDDVNYRSLKTENGIQSHISPHCFSVRPLHVNKKMTVHEIDLDHLATAMKNRLNRVLPWVHELRVCYNGWAATDTEVTNTIISDVNMMVDTAMAVTYNRLRFILQSRAPAVFAAQMNPRSPLSNKFKFPAFISSVLGGIGPLWIKDGLQDTCIVYATSSARSQTYGRSQPFEFNWDQFSRLIDNLAAIGAQLAPIDIKSGKQHVSFFPTILIELQEGLWNFTATCHYSNYRHRDIVSAWLTLNDDPTLRAFRYCSLKIECCTDPDVVSAVTASRPKGVPVDLDGDTAPARSIGGVFNVNVFGVQPAVAAEGGNPAVPAAVYILGRGDTRYYCCTSLARNLNELDMNSILREYILRYNTSWTSPRFQAIDYDS